MAVSKPLLTEFGIHYRLESCEYILNGQRFWPSHENELLIKTNRMLQELQRLEETVRWRLSIYTNCAWGEVRLSQNTIKIVKSAFTKIDCELVTVTWKHPVKPRREKGVRGRSRSTSFSFCHPPPILTLLTIIIACLIKMSECLPASVPPLSPEETLTGKQMSQLYKCKKILWFRETCQKKLGQRSCILFLVSKTYRGGWPFISLWRSYRKVLVRKQGVKKKREWLLFFWLWRDKTQQSCKRRWLILSF